MYEVENDVALIPDPLIREAVIKAAVRRLNLISISLTQIFVQELPENEIVITEDRIMVTNSKAAVRGLIHILPYLTQI